MNLYYVKTNNALDELARIAEKTKKNYGSLPWGEDDEWLSAKIKNFNKDDEISINKLCQLIDEAKTGKLHGHANKGLGEFREWAKRNKYGRI